MDKTAILIFGVGSLQQSLIEHCKAQGLYTVGIDPCEDAVCRHLVDAFEVVGGQDYDNTLAVAQKYGVSGVITAATDKPLIMMARVAQAIHLPFYSVDTAVISTDKMLMKQKFIEGGVPCARGFVLDDIDKLSEYSFDYPIIVKPRDNSGSRGVIYCENEQDVRNAWNEAIPYTRKASVLVEEYIDGPEFSIESIHYNGYNEVIQFTEKRTTALPYNVELGHIQPANFTEYQKTEIRAIIHKLGLSLGFVNCFSHTELKISSKGIKVIETSPRLGGGYITSWLSPLSTGVNLEDLLIKLSLGKLIEDQEVVPKVERYSGVVFFELPCGKINRIGDLSRISSIKGLQFYNFELKEGDIIKPIKSGLDRYGEAVFVADNRNELNECLSLCQEVLQQEIEII